MKMAKILLASSLALASMGAFAQGKPSAYTEKDLVWKEDFNGKKLNTKDWNYEFHEPGWVNAELQSYDEGRHNSLHIWPNQHAGKTRLYLRPIRGSSQSSERTGILAGFLDDAG